VKLDGEFNRSIVIDDLVDTVMEDVVPNHRERRQSMLWIPSICSQDGVPRSYSHPKAEASMTMTCGDAREQATKAAG
jgi:hypothetical protein